MSFQTIFWSNFCYVPGMVFFLLNPRPPSSFSDWYCFELYAEFRGICFNFLPSIVLFQGIIWWRFHSGQSSVSRTSLIQSKLLLLVLQDWLILRLFLMPPPPGLSSISRTAFCLITLICFGWLHFARCPVFVSDLLNCDILAEHLIVLQFVTVFDVYPTASIGRFLWSFFFFDYIFWNGFFKVLCFASSVKLSH